MMIFFVFRLNSPCFEGYFNKILIENKPSKKGLYIRKGEGKTEKMMI